MNSFDAIWKAIIQEHKENFPIDDYEATKLALEIFASKIAKFPMEGQGRIEKNITLASSAAKAAAVAAEKDLWSALKLYNDAIRQDFAFFRLMVPLLLYK